MNIIEELKEIRGHIKDVKNMPDAGAVALSCKWAIYGIDRLIAQVNGAVLVDARKIRDKLEYALALDGKIETNDPRYAKIVAVILELDYEIVNDKVFGSPQDLMMGLPGSASPLWGKGEMEGEG